MVGVPAEERDAEVWVREDPGEFVRRVFGHDAEAFGSGGGHGAAAEEDGEEV